MTNPPDNPLPPDPQSEPPAPDPIPEPEQPIAPDPIPEPIAQAQASKQTPELPPNPEPPSAQLQTPAPEPTSAPEPEQTPEPTQAPPPSDDREINRRTFVSFSAFIILGAAAWKSWFWLKDAVQSDGVQSPLRKGLNLDDKIFKHTLSPNHLAKTYPREQAAKNVRYNSGIGLGADPATWRLQVTTAENQMIAISMDELKALPKTDFAFEFKCIEGWSQVSWWGGVRFSDFIRHYNLTKETEKEYVGLSTPDDRYYIGIDTPSAMHPQTLLCYEMNGQPLPTRHGAPLRLIIPIKYGVKNLKCIGKMFFSDDRPRDYWFERGYDYYCGL